MKIPITMCHGVNPNPQRPLDGPRFRRYFGIARELGFRSITYEALAVWRYQGRPLPPRVILFDFDHPALSIRREIFPVMAEFGYVGNLFLNTAPLVEPTPPHDRGMMTWDDVREMLAGGWHIGAHTHTHPNLSDLAVQDPSGETIARELETGDELLKKHLGIEPRDFAFTGTSWSTLAERLVAGRYRFGRLWIIGPMYQADGRDIRYAELVGAAGPDEADGGPPCAARYVTETTHPYRLPSMELDCLVYEFDAFRAYLEGALEG